jgi:2-phospho-L-lactate guanylyltransferase
MHATVAEFDPQSQSGSVLLDDGIQIPFDAAAFAAGGLRTLRLGQRVRLTTDDPPPTDPAARPRITALTVATLPPDQT